MEDTKLDKLMTLAARIEERMNSVVDSQEETSERLDRIVEEVYMIKSDLRSMTERAESSTEKQNSKISSLETQVAAISSARKERTSIFVNNIINLFVGIVIGLITAKATVAFEKDVNPSPTNHVESHR